MAAIYLRRTASFYFQRKSILYIMTGRLSSFIGHFVLPFSEFNIPLLLIQYAQIFSYAKFLVDRVRLSFLR